MDRKNYFFRQRVTEAELDAGFDDVEAKQNAEKELFFLGVFAGTWGVDPTTAVTEHAPAADETLDVHGPVRCWDAIGRSYLDPNSLTNVDCSEDLNGNPTQVQLAGNEKWITVAIVFDRDLSDPRTDGEGNTVYHVEDEGYAYEVYQGAEAAAGLAVKPSVPTNRLVLVDCLRVWNKLTLEDADLDFDRLHVLTIAHSTRIPDAGHYSNFSPADYRTAETGPTVSTVLAAIDGWMTGHIDGTGDHHDAVDIDYDNTASGLTATDVQVALDEIAGLMIVGGDSPTFRGLMIDPANLLVATDGWISLWGASGGILVRGENGAAVGAYSKFQATTAQDGLFEFVQGQAGGNASDYGTVWAYTSAYAMHVRNDFAVMGSGPGGIEIVVPGMSSTSTGLRVEVGQGKAIHVRAGSLPEAAPYLLHGELVGCSAAGTVQGIALGDSAVPVGGLNCYGFNFTVDATNYTGDVTGYSATGGGANWKGFAAAMTLGSGFYAEVNGATGYGFNAEVDLGYAFKAHTDTAGGYLFWLSAESGGFMGTWACTTVNGGLNYTYDAAGGAAFRIDLDGANAIGLAVEVGNACNYGIGLTATATGSFAALIALSNAGATGKAIVGTCDPAQDWCVITGTAADGDATKAIMKVNLSSITTGATFPAAFHVLHKGNGKDYRAFYAEAGAFDYKASGDGYYGLDGALRWYAVDHATDWHRRYWAGYHTDSATAAGVSCDFVDGLRDVEAPANVGELWPVTKRRVATAWAQITDAGALVGGHFNVNSVAKTGTGIYEITLDVHGSPTGRAVQVTAQSRGIATECIVANVVNPLANPIVVHLHTVQHGGTVAYADEDFTVAVFQDA